MAEKIGRSVPQKQHAPGAEARFSFDRMTVERFRHAFPRARWSEERKSWFVPGKMANRRIDRWLAGSRRSGPWFSSNACRNKAGSSRFSSWRCIPDHNSVAPPRAA